MSTIGLGLSHINHITWLYLDFFNILIEIEVWDENDDCIYLLDNF